MAKQAKRETPSYAAFKATLADKAPPPGLTPAIVALWHAANGAWERAHEAAQKRDDLAGAWVHAYLHRLEGDLPNARYWYGRAGKPVATAAFGKEWEEIARALLS